MGVAGTEITWLIETRYDSVTFVTSNLHIPFVFSLVQTTDHATHYIVQLAHKRKHTVCLQYIT